MSLSAGDKKGAVAYDKEQEIFLPTKASMLLKSIVAETPNHTILLADFDQLPEVKIPGRNAPLVSTTVSHRFLLLITGWPLGAFVMLGMKYRLSL